MKKCIFFKKFFLVIESKSRVIWTVIFDSSAILSKIVHYLLHFVETCSICYCLFMIWLKCLIWYFAETWKWTIENLEGRPGIASKKYTCPCRLCGLECTISLTDFKLQNKKCFLRILVFLILRLKTTLATKMSRLHGIIWLSSWIAHVSDCKNILWMQPNYQFL